MSTPSSMWLAQLIFGIASLGSALTVLLMAWMLWVLSGVPRVRLERDLAALRRLDELGVEDVTWRQGAVAAAGRWARASVRLNPFAANRPSDLEWQRSLLKRHGPKIEEAGGLEQYAASTRLDAQEGVTALLALATGADRAGDAIAERWSSAVELVPAGIGDAPDVPSLRRLSAGGWRADLSVVWRLLREPRTWPFWSDLALSLVDYLGRGTAAGLFVAAVVSGGDVDRMISLAAVFGVCGATAALVIWQTQRLRAALGIVGASPRLDPATRRRLAFARRWAGLLLTAAYLVLLALDLGTG